MVYGGALGSLGAKPPKQRFQMQKIVYNLKLCVVRYKLFVTLTTFADSLKNVLQLLNQFFFAKLCLLFHVKKRAQISRHIFRTGCLEIWAVFLPSGILPANKVLFTFCSKPPLGGLEQRLALISQRGSFF